MLVTFTDTPIQEFIDAGIQPEVVFDYKSGERWMVPDRAIPFDDTPPSFSVVQSGELVRVPLFAYRTNDKQLHNLVGFAFELALRLYSRLHWTPARVHIALGNPVIDLSPASDSYRIHLGFALQT